MTLSTLNYGNYGIFLIMGHAGFCPSTVWSPWQLEGGKILEEKEAFDDEMKNDQRA